LFPALHLQLAWKLGLQTSTAANICTTDTGRLFITDKTSKFRFLIDTGSDLCVFPRKLIPQPRSRVNYDLCVANGTTISTYGWLPLSLNLGLCREFTWRFVVADVTQSLIGADFLSHFGLLVDCRNNRLLDGVTSLSAPSSLKILVRFSKLSKTRVDEFFKCSIHVPYLPREIVCEQRARNTNVKRSSLSRETISRGRYGTCITFEEFIDTHTSFRKFGESDEKCKAAGSKIQLHLICKSRNPDQDMNNSVYSREHALKLYTWDIEAPHRDKIQDWFQLDEGDTAFPLQTEEEIAAVISFFFPPYFHQH
jgi:hypothetical protein